MKIRSFKLVAALLSLFLLLMAKPVQVPSQVPRAPQVKMMATSGPSFSSFAFITTQGNGNFALGGHLDEASSIQHSTLSTVALPSENERVVTLARGKSVNHLPDGLAQPEAVTKRKAGHSISGRVVDINQRPVPGVRLSIDGVYRATTDATGHYTVTDLATATYTLMPGKPVYRFSPALRTIDLQVDGKGQDFVVEPDLGFRPERDGYSFDNPGGVTPDCQAFQQSFSGIDIRCSGDQPQSKYLALFERYKFSFRSGICTGMAAASLAYYAGRQAVPQPVPTFRLSFDESWPDIAKFHGRQYSKAVLDQRMLKLSAWNTTDVNAISQRVDEVYHRLRLAVQPGNPDPVVLDLVSRPGCESSGHTVTPYRLDETDPLRPKVYIYENFIARDSSRFIQFDFSSSEHRFSYWKWDSASCGTLVDIPISAFTGPEDKVPSVHLGQFVPEH